LEKCLVYNYTEVSKALLKLCKIDLKPTKEFVEAIKEVI
jgi:hypothetical protein